MAGTQSVGALIVELRANSAQFKAEMDGARGSLDKTGHSARLSSQQVARFAAIAVEQAVPGLRGMRVAMEQVIQQAVKFGPAVATLGGGVGALVGPVAGIIAAIGGGFLLGNFIQNFREAGSVTEGFGERIKVAAGFTESFAKRLKDATEEQKKFGTEAAKSRDIMRGLAKELATLQGDQDKALELTQQGREGSIIGALGGSKATAALALARKVAAAEEAKALADRRKLRDEDDQKLLDSILKDREAQVTSWKKETDALVEQLKTRLKLRQDFEAAFGQGGLPGQGQSQGLRASRDLAKQIEKESLDLAFAERQGLSQTDAAGGRENIRARALDEAKRLKLEFASFPAVLESIDRAVASIEFGNFGKEMAFARIEIERIAPSTESLVRGLGGIASRLIETLPATDSAAEAIRVLSAAYNELQFQIFGATQQLIAYEQQLAGGTQ